MSGAAQKNYFNVLEKIVRKGERPARKQAFLLICTSLSKDQKAVLFHSDRYGYLTFPLRRPMRPSLGSNLMKERFIGFFTYDRLLCLEEA